VAASKAQCLADCHHTEVTA